MNILVIHQYFLDKNQGGGARFNQFAKFWHRADSTVSVIAGMVSYTTGKKLNKWKGRFIVRESEDGVSVIRTHVSEQYNKSFLGRLWGYFSFTFSSILALFMIKNPPDIVIATSPPLFVGLTGIAAKWKFKVPLVFEVRDLWPESAIETGVLKNKALIKLSYWLEGLIYKKADAINVLTPVFREALIAKGISPDKIWLIPNGADLDLFIKEQGDTDVRTEYGWENRFVVMYIGAHGVANNLAQLVMAAEKLEKDKPEVLFVLVGDGMEKSALMDMVQDKGLSNVVFIPPQPKEKIKDFVHACDVGIAVLKNVEVFKTVYPNKVFDYMSCAKPVLLGIDGAARELVVNQAQCGIFCQPENVDQITDGIITYLRDEELRKQHGQNGFYYVKNHYNREVLANNYLDSLKKLAFEVSEEITKTEAVRP